MAYIDNNLYFMKSTGTNAGAAWSTKWAAAANTGDQIDLTTVANRHFLEAGFVVWQCIQVPAQAANSTTFHFGCAAAAVYPTTYFWTSGVVAFGVLNAYTALDYIFVIKIPPVIPLRYLSVGWTPLTTAWTAGTFNIGIAMEDPRLVGIV